MPEPTSALHPFLRGLKAACSSVFILVMLGTYVGVGALAHDFGFSVFWLTVSTLLMWAAPAQVIFMSLLAGGAALIEIAIAVTLSAIRLFPMVVALLPLLRQDGSRRIAPLIIPAHFTAVSMWVEALRLLPGVPREERIAFTNGLASGYMGAALIAGIGGFYLAASLPVLAAAALLFLTPLSFLLSTARNARMMIDRLALAFGLVLGPVLATYRVDLDLMWTGIIGGSAAYGVHRLREMAR